MPSRPENSLRVRLIRQPDRKCLLRGAAGVAVLGPAAVGTSFALFVQVKTQVGSDDGAWKKKTSPEGNPHTASKTPEVLSAGGRRRYLARTPSSSGAGAWDTGRRGSSPPPGCSRVCRSSRSCLRDTPPRLRCSIQPGRTGLPTPCRHFPLA